MPDTYKLQYDGMTLTYPGWNGYVAYESNNTSNVLDYYPIGSYLTTKNDDFDPNVEWGGYGPCTWTAAAVGGGVSHENRMRSNMLFAG